MRPGKLIKQARNFFINNQWKFSLITIIALAFLFLKQTNYFEPFFSVPFLVIFLLLWLLTISLFRLRPPLSFILAVFFLVTSGGLLLVGIKPWAERAALYAYGFFIIGLVQELITEVAINNRWKKL